MVGDIRAERETSGDGKGGSRRANKEEQCLGEGNEGSESAGDRERSVHRLFSIPPVGAWASR